MHPVDFNAALDALNRGAFVVLAEPPGVAAEFVRLRAAVPDYHSLPALYLAAARRVARRPEKDNA
jgi:hypothetical protein